jgi:hypothetical protein
MVYWRTDAILKLFSVSTVFTDLGEVATCMVMQA